MVSLKYYMKSYKLLTHVMCDILYFYIIQGTVYNFQIIFLLYNYFR